MTIKIHTFHSKSIPVIINIDDWPYDLNKLNFPFRVTSKDSPSNYNNLIPDCLTIQLSNHSNISIKTYCHRNRNILSIYDKDVLIALLNIYLNQKRSIHPSYLGRDTKSLPLDYLTTSPIKLTTIANELGYNLPVNQYILSNIYTSLQNLRLTSYEINNSHGFSILEDLSISHTDNTIVARLSTTTYNKVKQRLQNNKRNASNKSKEPYILSGKIKCGICGSAMVGHTSKCGRSKNKYSTYRCGRRYKYKDCNMKPINRDYLNEIVLNKLSEHFFSENSINKLTKELTKTYNKSLKNNTSNLKNIEKNIKSIDKEINNLINAIANGLNHPSLKAKLDTLESEKSSLAVLKTELEYKLNNSILDEKLIREYLLKDSLALKSKSVDDLKSIINTYVDSVIIYEDKVEVNLIFVHINGGGEGSCAPLISYTV